MDLYAENILDHYRTPRHKEQLREPSVSHNEINVSCGDTLTIDLSIKEGRIKDIGWDGSGCAISQAAMSMLAEELKEMSVDEAAKLSADDVHTMLGVPIGPRRIKCALLALHALQNALRKTEEKDPQSWKETISPE